MQLPYFTKNKPVISHDGFTNVTSLSIQEEGYDGIKTWYFKGNQSGLLWSAFYKGFKEKKESGVSKFRPSTLIPMELLDNKEYIGLRKIRLETLSQNQITIEIDSVELAIGHTNMQMYYQVFDELVRAYNTEENVLKLSISEDLIRTAHEKGLLNLIQKYKGNREFKSSQENTNILLEKSGFKLAQLQSQFGVTELPNKETGKLAEIIELKKKRKNLAEVLPFRKPPSESFSFGKAA